MAVLGTFTLVVAVVTMVVAVAALLGVKPQVPTESEFLDLTDAPTDAPVVLAVQAPSPLPPRRFGKQRDRRARHELTAEVEQFKAINSILRSQLREQERASTVAAEQPTTTRLTQAS